MQVQKIDNTNFRGFEFKNTHAQNVFENKLSKTQKSIAENINQYMAKTANEPRTVYINATSAKMRDSKEYLLFATFSDGDKLIVDSSYYSGSLKRFINRCAAEAGYEPMQTQNSAVKLLKKAGKIINTITG